MADVFVSYSRRDAGFVRRLAHDLEGRGKDVWVDVDGIRDAEVFPQALRRAIEGSDAFVFVISPDAVRSEFCEQEVTHAAQLNKRIVPLALRHVPDAEIPDEIRFRNWIPAGDDDGDGGGDGDLTASVDRLVAAIETDLGWEHQHTRLTVKALEWDGAGRDRSFLVRGSELAAAERWLAAGAGKDRGPTALEQEYLLAGRAAVSRRQRALVGASLAVAVVAVGLLVFALVSRSQAVSAATTARSRALAAESATQLSVDPERSILLAGAAVRTAPTADALFALRAALDASPIRYRLPDAGLQQCGAGAGSGSYPGPGAPAVSFSADGRLIAEGLCDGTVVIADAATGHVIRRLHLSGSGGQLTFAPAGGLLAGLSGGRIVVVDPFTGVIARRGPTVLTAPRLVFRPGSPVIAVVEPSGLAMWDYRTGRTRHVALPAGVAPYATALAFSPDGRRVVVALGNPNLPSPPGQPGQPGLVVVDATSGRALARSPSMSSVVAFSPNGRQIVSGEVDGGTVGVVAIRSAATLRLERTLAQTPDVVPSAVAFSRDGSRVAYGAADGTAGLASVATRAAIVSYLGQTAAVTEVAFTPDGHLVATASADGTLRVWRATGATPGSATVGLTADVAPVRGGFVALTQPPGGPPVVRRWSDGGRPLAPPLRLGRSANVDANFISGDGRLAGLIAASTGQAQPVQIWDIATRRPVASVPPAPPPQGAEPVFSPDGRTIAMAKILGPGQAGQAGQFDLLDVATGRDRLLGGTPCPSGWRGYAFSANGRLVAAGSFCGQVNVWNVATGHPVGRPLSIGGELASIAFRPGGTQMAIASWNSTITVADAATGRVISVLHQNTKGVPLVAYSPDGRYLASAGLDHTIRIWDARTLIELRVMNDPSATYGVVFTPDSRAILSWDQTNAVREWDGCTDCENPLALLALARTRVTRRLTAQERRTFGVG